ncbi:MAG: hypothetical protein ABSB22_15215 [Thermodesulfobacteriota bacterium]|jgi:hypothetical protein
MPAVTPIIISSAVEGVVDEAVVKRLIVDAGGEIGPIYGKRGKSLLRQRINGYNNAARHDPWIVLVDLNREADCPPPLKAVWLPNPEIFMCFRIAVREVEAWLLADRERFASFFRVRLLDIPADPELMDDPKEVVIELSRKSRSRDIRLDMVPRPGSGRKIGPAYVSRMVEFVSDPNRGWRPDRAAESSVSLKRCLTRIRELVARVE